MESVFLDCKYSDQLNPLERHFHNSYELIYIRSGTARFFIGESCYTADSGSVLFISKLEEHSVKILHPPYRRYYLQLSSAQLERCVDDMRLKSVFMSRPAGFSHCFSLSGRKEEADRLFEEIEQEYHVPDAFSSQRLIALLRLLLILCYRTCSSQFPIPKEPVPESVLRIQSYLDVHFALPLKLEELARQFFISNSYLSHSFQKWTGYSPKRYLMLCRLSYAKRLLQTTERSISDIATACGFQDTSNFIRSFRQEMGATPAAYRKENKI